MLFPAAGSEQDRIQGRLLTLSAAFLLLYSVVLTLSPAVRLHSLDVPLRWNHWAGFGVWLLSYALFHRQVERRLPGRDPYLLPVVALLTGWGLLTVWRLDEQFGLRQTVWLALSLGAAALLLEKPQVRSALRRYKYVLLVSGLLLTALTFAVGTYPGGEGPRLWLGCCTVYLQPSEPLKLLLILYLAAFLADRMTPAVDLRQMLPPTLVMAGAAVLLLLAQRDLGTTTLVVLIYTMLLYLASGHRRILLLAVVLIILMSVGGYFLFDVIRLRVEAWLTPWLDPSGRSFQIVQSLLAFSAGGLFGAGPGMGSPGLVPVAHSDFIAAAIGEETGLLGMIGLVMLYALLVGRGTLTAIRASSRYNRLLAAGVTGYLALQAILIAGGNLRLLPLTGVTLPLVSYGGSSLLTAILAFALLLAASDRQGADSLPPAAPQPLLYTAGLLMAGLFAVALISGWWSVAAAPRLQERQDNPRRAISERYMERGPILDHNNRPLVESTGQPGSFTRVFSYPPLSAAVGYHHPVYGQSGVEASMDRYLRGVAAVPTMDIITNQLLFNQPPPGLSVRLSIDLGMQQDLDQALGERLGAGVLLQASSGEVLAMASHPFVDPNRLDEQWPDLINDPNAPLVNRATLGQYPIGTSLAPFLLSAYYENSSLPFQPAVSENLLSGCSVPPDDDPGWNQLVRYACPGILEELAATLTTTQLQNLYRSLGFFSVPEVGIPVAAPGSLQPGSDRGDLYLGRTSLRVTPLQMALASASVTHSGFRPSPRLVTAVRSIEQGWIVLPGGSHQTVFTPTAAARAAASLAYPDLPIWETLALADNQGSAVWYLAGTLPQWQGAPLTMAILLENTPPAETLASGREAFRNILQTD